MGKPAEPEERARRKIGAAQTRQAVLVAGGHGQNITVLEKIKRGVANSTATGASRHFHKLLTSDFGGQRRAGLVTVLGPRSVGESLIVQAAAAAAFAERQPSSPAKEDPTATQLRELIVSFVLVDADLEAEDVALLKRAPPMFLLELFFAACTNWWCGPLLVLILQ